MESDLSWAYTDKNLNVVASFVEMSNPKTSATISRYV